MKYCKLFFLLIFCHAFFSTYSQQKNEIDSLHSFDSTSFTKVVAYNFALKDDKTREHEVYSIVEHGRLHRSAKRPGVVLTAKQVKELIKVLTDTSTYGRSPAACFEPRLAFVFYDKSDSIVADVNICFECNILSSNPRIPAQAVHDYLMDDGTTVPRRGFSKSGRKKLIRLCESLNMYYCTKGPSMFD